MVLELSKVQDTLKKIVKKDLFFFTIFLLLRESTWILVDTNPRESRRESIRGFASNFYPWLYGSKFGTCMGQC